MRCADGAGGSARTFQIAGHHYALIPVTGLTPGTTTAYEVLLDGTPGLAAARLALPAQRASAPPRPARRDRPPSPSAPAAGPHRPPASTDPVGPDALDTLAARLAADPEAERPGRAAPAGRPGVRGRDVQGDPALARRPPRPDASRRAHEVADYEEYTRLYYESWLDPEVRWLLSTVPSCMIFDDHDVIDDWNTSAAWLADMRATPWWRERLLSGLMSYWVYQHLGNLSPAELAADPLYAAVRDDPRRHRRAARLRRARRTPTRPPSAGATAATSAGSGC